MNAKRFKYLIKRIFVSSFILFRPSTFTGAHMGIRDFPQMGKSLRKLGGLFPYISCTRCKAVSAS
jgi:hypothetical protein